MVTLSSRRPSRFVRAAARALHTDEKRIEVWERLILTSFVVTLLVYGARYAHLLEGVENWWLDKMAYVDRPRFNAPITVIAITDSDYYNLTTGPQRFRSFRMQPPRSSSRRT